MDHQRIEALVSQLEEANQLYAEGMSFLSDEEFDALLDELKALDPDHVFLKQVGSSLHEEEAVSKIYHDTAMLSSAKVKPSKSSISGFNGLIYLRWISLSNQK